MTPNWKNTFACNTWWGEVEKIRKAAHEAGYSYYEWNGSVYNVSGMWPGNDESVCLSSDLDLEQTTEERNEAIRAQILDARRLIEYAKQKMETQKAELAALEARLTP